MPIYAYRCEACGHAKDVLQKLSDAVLTTCPACGAEAFSKQVTAAGFQLKGSGWYVTDFRNGNTGAAAKKDEASSAEAGAPAAPAAPGAPATGATPAAAPAPTAAPAAAPAPAAAATPATSSGSGSSS
jgi:putative FmdB family regulatory protein